MTDLRDYQVLAVDKLQTAGDRALYVLPTGGGKTVIATNAIERSVQRGDRVLMLTHRREILRQTSLKLPIDHGLIQAGLNIDLSYPVQVASVQTLYAMAGRPVRRSKTRPPKTKSRWPKGNQSRSRVMAKRQSKGMNRVMAKVPSNLV